MIKYILTYNANCSRIFLLKKKVRKLKTKDQNEAKMVSSLGNENSKRQTQDIPTRRILLLPSQIDVPPTSMLTDKHSL